MNKDITIQSDTHVWLTVEYTNLKHNSITEEFDLISVSIETRLWNIEDTFKIETEDQSGGGVIIELDTAKVNEIKQSMTIDAKSEELQYSNPCYTEGIMLGLILLGFLLVKKLLK